MTQRFIEAASENERGEAKTIDSTTTAGKSRQAFITTFLSQVR
jgi:hypothetical protein